MPSDTIRILSFSRSSDRTYCMPSERSVVFGCAIPLPCQLSVANRQQSHRPRRNPVRPPRMQGATPEKTRSPPLSRRSGRIRPSACARSIRRPQRRTSCPPVRRAAVPHVRSARHRLRYCPIRCRTTSKSITAAAAETLSDSICPISGMASCSSQSLSTSFEIPRSSAPITSTVGRRKSAS